MVKINFVVAEVKEVVITSYSHGDLDHFFNGWQFVIAAEITFRLAVITSSVFKITNVAAEIIFNVAVITTTQ